MVRVWKVAAGLVLGLIVLGGLPSAAAFEMKAGTARVVITNDEPLVMVNGRTSAGVLHDIYARALVLNDGRARFAIVTYDLNCLDVATAILRKRVNDDLGIPPERLILLATHNHSAPIQIVPDNFAYGRELAAKLFDLVRAAIQNEQGPVRLLFGTGHGDFIAASGNAPADSEIQLLKVERDGEPVAMLFNQPTHPAQASLNKVGVGHPGYAMDAIESEFPGVLAMYADAAGGNQRTIAPEGYAEAVRAARRQGPEAVDPILEKNARRVGDLLAREVMRINAGPLADVTGPIESKLEIISLPLAPPISREELAELESKTPMDAGFVPYPHRARGTNWVRMLRRHYDKGLPFPERTTDWICTDDTYLVQPASDAELMAKYDYSIPESYRCVYEETIVSKLGPMIFVAMQGEVCAPIGMRIKDAFRRRGPIMLFAYMGEHNLYIPTRELVRLKAYQSRVIQIQYASPVGWAPEVEDEMVAAVIEMGESLLGGGE